MSCVWMDDLCVDGWMDGWKEEKMFVREGNKGKIRKLVGWLFGCLFVKLRSKGVCKERKYSRREGGRGEYISSEAQQQKFALCVCSE